ncbi:MAG: hypothetical protein AB1634_06455 [Thermodesulfobacteriota bacterium]
MIHSGINIYMTLMLAQVYLRAGDERFHPLLAKAAGLASPTGQWPEAIHPHTLGGCMGDGQHGWAAAEWVMLMRHLFVFEEGERLVIGRGIRRPWLESGEPLSFGPTLTPFGKVTVSIHPQDRLEVRLAAQWYGARRPEVVVAIPGFGCQAMGEPDWRCQLEPHVGP